GAVVARGDLVVLLDVDLAFGLQPVDLGAAAGRPTAFPAIRVVNSHLDGLEQQSALNELHVAREDCDAFLVAHLQPVALDLDRLVASKSEAAGGLFLAKTRSRTKQRHRKSNAEKVNPAHLRLRPTRS